MLGWRNDRQRNQKSEIIEYKQVSYRVPVQHEPEVVWPHNARENLQASTVPNGAKGIYSTKFSALLVLLDEAIHCNPSFYKRDIVFMGADGSRRREYAHRSVGGISFVVGWR